MCVSRILSTMVFKYLSMAYKWLLCGHSVRQNLKILKKTATLSEHDDMDQYEEETSGILMFWCIYGMFHLWELHIEPVMPLIHWIPGYSYCKIGLLTISAFPSLKVTKVLFKSVLVPSLENFHYNPLPKGSGPVSTPELLVSLALFATTIMVTVAFPPAARLMPKSGGRPSEEELAAEQEDIARAFDEALRTDKRGTELQQHDDDNDSRRGRRDRTSSFGPRKRSKSRDTHDALHTPLDDGTDTEGKDAPPWLDSDLFDQSARPTPTTRETIFNFNFPSLNLNLDVHHPSAASTRRASDRRRITMDLQAQGRWHQTSPSGAASTKRAEQRRQRRSKEQGKSRSRSRSQSRGRLRSSSSTGSIGKKNDENRSPSLRTQTRASRQLPSSTRSSPSPSHSSSNRTSRKSKSPLLVSPPRHGSHDHSSSPKPFNTPLLQQTSPSLRPSSSPVTRSQVRGSAEKRIHGHDDDDARKDAVESTTTLRQSSPYVTVRRRRSAASRTEGGSQK